MAEQLSIRDTLTLFVERCQQKSNPGADVQTLECKLSGQPLSLVFQRPHDGGPGKQEGFITCTIPVFELTTGREQTYRALLQANNLWAGTRGATLGLVDDDLVVLSISRPVHGMTGPLLHGLIKRLSFDARAWSTRLQAVSQPVSDAALHHPFA